MRRESAKLQIINFLKTKINLPYIRIYISLLAENTVCFHYEDLSVDAAGSERRTKSVASVWLKFSF